jgi:hypothetical protein
MTADPESFEEFRKRDPPPDLQQLVERYGGYSRVPPEAWAKIDAAMAAWERRRRVRLVRGMS